VVDTELAPFNARQHRGKLFTIDPKVLRSRYEKLDVFKKLVSVYDPKGKFKNEFLQKNIYN
jgi:alditol oxidase